MDLASNPYTPGAGTPPPALVGRQEQLDSGRVVIARTAQGRPAEAPILYGLRGVGKTVLLKELQRQSDAAGWVTVEIEGKQDPDEQILARRRLARGLIASVRAVAPPSRWTDSWRRALGSLSSFSVGVGVTGVQVGVGIEPRAGTADSGDATLDLEELVREMAPALEETGIGLAIFVDEIQDLDPTTLSALLSVRHRASQNRWPFQLYGAGLPTVPGRLAEVRSYAERFPYTRIGALSDADARAALSEPARDEGIHFEERALEILVEISGGYPYFLQIFGDQAWKTAAGPETITEDDALVAVSNGTALLDESLFHSRWDRATPTQKDLMRAMSLDAGSSQIAVLVERLGKRRPSDLSVTRDALIKKGLIFAPERGVVAFTVPHMGDFIRRQNEE